jgi:hypothetical protein
VGSEASQKKPSAGPGSAAMKMSSPPPSTPFVREAFWVKPRKTVRACADPDDGILLECARAGRAPYLLTGNLKRFPATRLVTASGGWLLVTCPEDGSQMSMFLARPPRGIRRSLGVPESHSGYLAFVSLQAVDSTALAGRLLRASKAATSKPKASD